jgi:hypothetical protein
MDIHRKEYARSKKFRELGGEVYVKTDRKD